MDWKDTIFQFSRIGKENFTKEIQNKMSQQKNFGAIKNVEKET